MSYWNVGQQKLVIFLPAAIASSRMSLNRCESNLGSEQSIEQNSLQCEVTQDIKLKSFQEKGCCSSQGFLTCSYDPCTSCIDQSNHFSQSRIPYSLPQTPQYQLQWPISKYYKNCINENKNNCTTRNQEQNQDHILKQLPSCTLL